MTSIHEPPKTQADRMAILQIVADQARQTFDAEQSIVTCGNPECRRDIKIIHTFRCFFCGIRFCRRCAKIHFGPGQAS